jgi:ligand-binding SRPBCC domain-containing protein
MHIRLSTKVNGNYKKVMEQFERPLFEALKPAGLQMEIVEFTGSRKGDRVHIRLTSLRKDDWVSLITEDGISEKEAWFVDEGTVMPFGFTYWRHRHIVQKHSETTSVIVDDLTFKAKNFLVAWFFYPVFWWGLYRRKKVYRRFFRDL